MELQNGTLNYRHNLMPARAIARLNLQRLGILRGMAVWQPDVSCNTEFRLPFSLPKFRQYATKEAKNVWK